MGMLDGKVAIVTGAGNGVGRGEAVLLAAHGAKVVVNDLGGSVTGDGSDAKVADQVVEVITSRGGEAVANYDSVADYDGAGNIVKTAIDAFGRLDVLVNNAGILRDRTFAKMPLDDFQRVLDVHLMGAVHATKAVWPQMMAQRYGRIVMTTSSSGLYGNFGQSNYGAAKMALVGLMQTLALEGAKYGVHVNCLAPTAATAMTEGVLPSQVLAHLGADRVSPALLALVRDQAPSRMILLAGAGSFECANITMTRGIYLGEGSDTAEQLCARLDEVTARTAEIVPASGGEQYELEIAKATAG
jgi:NAD(P)-dependent dehydrogenase (short-subunit alcohol dehydrogenase family)